LGGTILYGVMKTERLRRSERAQHDRNTETAQRRDDPEQRAARFGASWSGDVRFLERFCADDIFAELRTTFLNGNKLRPSRALSPRNPRSSLGDAVVAGCNSARPYMSNPEL
jgi:hypothetical protein